MIEKSDIIKLGVGVALLMAVAAGIDYWKEKRYREEDERAYRIYKLEQEIVSSPSKEKVEALLRASGDSIYALAVAAEYGGREYLKRLISKLEDEHLKKLFLEKEAFLLYREGKLNEALDKLSGIKNKDFNYPSALILKGFIYEAKGDTERAEEIYKRVLAKYPVSYFGKLANTRLTILESLKSKG